MPLIFVTNLETMTYSAYLSMLHNRRVSKTTIVVIILVREAIYLLILHFKDAVKRESLNLSPLS